jgi:hypothetical protein
MHAPLSLFGSMHFTQVVSRGGPALIIGATRLWSYCSSIC